MRFIRTVFPTLYLLIRPARQRLQGQSTRGWPHGRSPDLAEVLINAKLRTRLTSASSGVTVFVVFRILGGKLQYGGRLLEELRAPEAAVEDRHQREYIPVQRRTWPCTHVGGKHFFSVLIPICMRRWKRLTSRCCHLNFHYASSVTAASPVQLVRAGSLSTHELAALAMSRPARMKIRKVKE